MRVLKWFCFWWHGRMPLLNYVHGSFHRKTDNLGKFEHFSWSLLAEKNAPKLRNYFAPGQPQVRESILQLWLRTGFVVN